MKHAIRIDEKFNPAKHPFPCLEGDHSLWVGRFQAMASDCEILMEGVSKSIARKLLTEAAKETWRIEHKFSRYLQDNLLWQINHHYHQPLQVDQETSGLLNFADQCYQLSDGMFDITSGVLRQVWRFDGGTNIPKESEIKPVIECIGWDKVHWDGHQIQLKPGMEIDLGGIGKEYAVDRVTHLLKSNTTGCDSLRFVVNFGGDLASNGPRLSGEPWIVGIESSEKDGTPVAKVDLAGGAVATSGDSRRYVIDHGKRLSHILNPKTGRPVDNPPHAISVAAASCLQAGMLSTMAMLHGEQAEDFLKAQQVVYWIQN